MAVGRLVGSACAGWWVEETDRCRLKEEIEKSVREELRRSFSYTQFESPLNEAEVGGQARVSRLLPG